MNEQTPVSPGAPDQPPAYKNPALPSATRVQDLLNRMTLEEKAEQMLCVWQEKAQKLVDAAGNFDLVKAEAAFNYRRAPGQIGRPSDAGGGKSARGMAELTNAIQKFFLERTRLGIPVVFHEECLHGHAAPEGTSYPQPIALGATEHASARGAALLGAVAAGIAPSTAESTWPLPGDTRVMDPIPAQAALYAERSAVYREMYGRLPKG